MLCFTISLSGEGLSLSDDEPIPDLANERVKRSSWENLRTKGSYIIIRITCPCDLYPLTPQFYIVKLGVTGVYLFSYFCSKTDCV